MRTKNLITYPKLNDKKGDISKKWYVEYSYRLPGNDVPFKQRIFVGLSTGTADERRKIAQEYIERITEYLKSGDYLNQEINFNPLKDKQKGRPEYDNYIKALKDITVSDLVQEYLDFISPTIRYGTLRTYASKFKYFVEFVERDLGGATINKITRDMLLPFFRSRATDHNNCRHTCDQYRRILYQFFDFCIDKGVVETNPIYKIPRYGAIVDCSAVPFDRDDRERLKAAIEPRDPFLWLACEMMYYCAIRPGMEIRLLRVRDIDKENCKITIPSTISKNKLTESVGVPKFIIEQMERLAIFSYSPDYYVWGNRGIPGANPYGKSTMRVRFDQFRDELKISKTKKFYSWKHSGAISAAQNGMPIIELKDHLRHKSVATTEIYLRKRVPRTDRAKDFIETI